MTDTLNSANHSTKNTSKKQGFFKRLFKKKKSDIKEPSKPKNLTKPSKPSVASNSADFNIHSKQNPFKDISKDKEKSKSKKPAEPKDKHYLDKLKKIDEDIQIGNTEVITKEVPSESKVKKPESIEDISYSDDGFHLDKLRQALGLVKQDSEKDLQIKKFKESLYNTDSEEDIVTDLSLEHTLEDKLNLSPLDLVKQENFKTSINTPAPSEHLFVLANGKKLASLQDLKDSLFEMSDEVFANHVYANHNDFANWIQKIFKDKKLANIIKECTSRNLLLAVLEELENRELDKLLLEKESLLNDKKTKLSDLEFIKKEKEELKDKEQNLSSEEKNVDAMKKKFENLKSEYEQKLQKISEENDKLKTEEKNIENEEKEVSELKKEYQEKIKKNHQETEALKARLMQESRKHAKELEEQYQERMKQLEQEDIEKTKKMDAILAEKKNQLESAYAIKKSNLEKEFESRQKELDQDNNIKIEHLENLKQQFKDEQKQYDELFKEKLKQIKEEQEKLFSLQKDLKKQELGIVKKNKDIESRLRKLDKKLAESKNFDFKIRQDINEKNKKIAQIKQEQANLRNKEIALEREGFKAYLNEKLKEISSPAGIKKEVIKLKREDTDPIYQLIDACKNKLNDNKIDEAQKIYSEIRDQFYKLHLPKNEKSMLFNAIRELYADINISMI